MRGFLSDVNEEEEKCGESREIERVVPNAGREWKMERRLLACTLTLYCEDSGVRTWCAEQQ